MNKKDKEYRLALLEAKKRQLKSLEELKKNIEYDIKAYSFSVEADKAFLREFGVSTEAVMPDESVEPLNIEEISPEQIKAIEEFQNIEIVNNGENVEFNMKDPYAIKYDLSDYGDLICQLYKIFYNKDLDFSTTKPYEEIQIMFSILKMFNIEIDVETEFHKFFTGIEYPYSYELNDIVLKELAPCREIKDINIEIDNDIKRKVNLIGQIITEQKAYKEKPEYVPLLLSSVAYYKDYDINSERDGEKIAEYLKCPYEDVESAVMLFKAIDYRLQKTEEKEEKKVR